MFGAENMAFGGSEKIFNLLIREAMELERSKLLAKALDDTSHGVVNGRVFAHMGGRKNGREGKKER
jgi:hypothetical protein